MKILQELLKEYMEICNPPSSPFRKGGVTKEFISKTPLLSFHGLTEESTEVDAGMTIFHTPMQSIEEFFD